ncbi:xanthine dehydrogenase family protein molybdopterin-binding subunit [Thalassotalea sp. LPB0316]|uniref:xanthine dehydrogenase family protein molybdopterin-binding subunit n=1 Tax=Thalassotalea sp. LPB0316 TaxID=2769490 RepID=UPI0018664B4C|nr:molybdopterin cofactor-binding domain-containing protein [Thalassotalea sp. LPB0316]QOL24665.1 xanthine dehydrogenase family protein molybdopterin-binding subunit [Thalassotalea sp. LPB0316]
MEQVKASQNVVVNVSRRRFIQGLGLGSSALVLGLSLPGFSALASGQTATEKAEHALNFFVAIDNDGTTSIVCHRAEMGQGIHTSIPQMIADELEADWAQVVMVQGKADKRYGSQGTAGSTSIRNQYIQMRQIGASARQMLEQAAANKWQVPLAKVSAENHRVKNLVTGESIGFGALAMAASALEAPKTEAIKLKSPEQFRYIGKSVKLFNIDDIAAGKAIYAQDIQLPDMLIASIARPPVVGGKVKSFDASKALKVKGVVDVIQLKDRNMPVSVLPLSGVAVLATNTWAAHQGRKQLIIEWDHGDNASHNTKQYQQELIDKVNAKGISIRQKGDVYQHKYDDKRTVEATYSVPYINHSPMETPSATAVVTGSGDNTQCVVWAGTQNPQWAQSVVAAELGLREDKLENVEINLTLMGGAFGRKSKADFIVEAVELSQKVKRPVKVVWTREDDIQHGFYHSISANYLKAELTADNKADFWLQRVTYPPIGWLFNDKQDKPSHRDLSLGFGDIPFELNNLMCETQTVTTHIRTGWVRSVACINNGFALGSFVDELAVKANIPTRQMWLNLLGSDRHIDELKDEGFDYSNYGMDYSTHPIDVKRMKSLINLISDKAQVEEKLPENQGWGISFLRSFGSYVAAATKVEVTNNTVKVLEMHTAIDCGVAVTPDRVKSQMEGAMIFGLSITLMGEITTKDGKVEQSNFHDSPVTRMHQSPPMFVHIVESNEPPGGVGEPGVPPIIPSITNAIYHACGKRIRHLPVNKTMSV